jgi:hypothetical protein
MEAKHAVQTEATTLMTFITTPQRSQAATGQMRGGGEVFEFLRNGGAPLPHRRTDTGLEPEVDGLVEEEHG